MAVIALHIGPKSAPVEIFVTADSIGWEPAKPKTRHSGSRFLPVMGTRPADYPETSWQLNQYARLGLGARPKRALGTADDHAQWNIARTRAIEALQAEWDAEWARVQAAAQAEHDDRTYAQSTVWQGFRWIPWQDGTEAGASDDHCWRVHESPAEIAALVRAAGVAIVAAP